MELLLVLLPFLALGGLAWLAGADSRDGFSDRRPVTPGRPFR
jgi:hypothetical protein